MPSHWILKTEPSTYAYDDLVRDGGTPWDGVRNAVALKHLRTMARGDHVLIYHTGTEKACIGLARVTSAPYPDPSVDDPKLVVVDVQATRRLKRPVPLADIKADATFAEMALVRQGRLSVVPATKRQWDRLLALGGL